MLVNVLYYTCYTYKLRVITCEHHHNATSPVPIAAQHTWRSVSTSEGAARITTVACRRGSLLKLETRRLFAVANLFAERHPATAPVRKEDIVNSCMLRTSAQGLHTTLVDKEIALFIYSTIKDCM